LIGAHDVVGPRQGEWSAIRDGDETIGAALRTRSDCTPMYISAGHRVSLDTALRLTLSVCDGTRVPRPTREADRYVSRTKRETGQSEVPGLRIGKTNHRDSNF
ncbi:MAG TPA: endonuclease V, partial [Candidatus Acidoferrum sp.]|nr:endonuclease V [Candidatus Acidoferrum sp.]